MSVDIIVIVAGDVPVVALASALEQAGLRLRYDRASRRLIIRPAGRMRTVAPELAKLLNRIAAGGAPP